MMNICEMEKQVKELRQLQALIKEAQAEAEAIKDSLKALWLTGSCTSRGISYHMERYKNV